MHKSSIYLPEDLKRSLSQLAGRSGRSEADLIRQAIERMLATTSGSDRDLDLDAAEPTISPRRPALVGVGVGPGDPGLVTARAKATLLAADRVLVISTDTHSVGRAEMVVRSVAPTAHVRRLAFAIADDSAARDASLADLADAVVAALDAAELVAVAVIGDPTQWTIFPELAGRVLAARPGVSVSAEPGITSYQAAAGAVAAPLGQAGGELVVLDDVANLDRHLAEPGRAIVLYKASTDAATLQAAAARNTRDGGLVAELSGLPGQRVVALADTDEGPISYLAAVVFPARSAAEHAR